jgi:hypothetical protein
MMSEALQQHRKRMSQRGMKRVEVCVREPDADMIRRVAKALVSDEKAAEGLRAAIDTILPTKTSISFKEWLMSGSSDMDETPVRKKRVG